MIIVQSIKIDILIRTIIFSSFSKRCSLCAEANKWAKIISIAQIGMKFFN